MTSSTQSTSSKDLVPVILLLDGEDRVAPKQRQKRADQMTQQEMIQLIFDPKGNHLDLSVLSSLKPQRTNVAHVHHMPKD